MLEAIVERGIGETRAIVLDDGKVVEIHVERLGGWRAGDIREVRLTQILAPGIRGIVAADGVEALLTPLPRHLTQGIALRIEVVREAIAETGRARLAKVIATTAAVRGGPELPERMAAREISVRYASSHGDDLLEAGGWSELVETALTGIVSFPGGTLTISPTPAMTVIDVDGDLPPAALALAAADAAGRALRLFDITGSIGIDFPTVADKAVRAAVGTRLDAVLPPPFERTAVNGFGFAQIIRPRLRPSLLELLRADLTATAALRLLRRAEREGFGDADLVAAPALVEWVAAHPSLLAELERRRGGTISLRRDDAMPMSGGYVASRH